jgi:hypothetical protein
MNAATTHAQGRRRHHERREKHVTVKGTVNEKMDHNKFSEITADNLSLVSANGLLTLLNHTTQWELIVASDGHTLNPEIIQRLLRSKNVNARAALAARKDTPEVTLRELLTDKSVAVGAAALLNMPYKRLTQEDLAPFFTAGKTVGFDAIIERGCLYPLLTDEWMLHLYQWVTPRVEKDRPGRYRIVELARALNDRKILHLLPAESFTPPNYTAEQMRALLTRYSFLREPESRQVGRKTLRAPAELLSYIAQGSNVPAHIWEQMRAIVERIQAEASSELTDSLNALVRTNLGNGGQGDTKISEATPPTPMQAMSRQPTMHTIRAAAQAGHSIAEQIAVLEDRTNLFLHPLTKCYPDENDTILSWIEQRPGVAANGHTSASVYSALLANAAERNDDSSTARVISLLHRDADVLGNFVTWGIISPYPDALVNIPLPLLRRTRGEGYAAAWILERVTPAHLDVIYGLWPTWNASISELLTSVREAAR